MSATREKQQSHMSRVLLIAKLAFFCCSWWPSFGYAIAIYDLRADWSNTTNPNGVWSYNAGLVALPYTASWPGDTFSAPQPGWAGTIPFSTRVPFWFRSSATPLSSPGYDWQIGDVVVHTQDDDNGPARGLANVTWTSPGNGTIDIAGGVWMGRDIGRADHWALLVGSTMISQGDISSGDPYSRASPFDFALGSGGAGVLQNIPVLSGDVVELLLARTSFNGDYVGVNLTINAALAGSGGSSSGVPDTSSTAKLLGISVAVLSWEMRRGQKRNLLKDQIRG